jgi:hypothetical protein
MLGQSQTPAADDFLVVEPAIERFGGRRIVVRPDRGVYCRQEFGDYVARQQFR